MKKAEVYNISTSQYRHSSGLLGKTTNIQNIYYCNIINRSYMLRPTKVWQLRKIVRKKDKDYEIIIICLVCIFVNFPKKNLTKTGIGQSKYCIHQPFSRCLISLCCGLFHLILFYLFRLITILFDPTLGYIDRSRFLHYSSFFFGAPREMEVSLAEIQKLLWSIQTCAVLPRRFN